jgi:hypothetical protein
MPLLRSTLSIFVLLALSTTCIAQPSIDYTRDVKPLMAQYCNSCHGPKVHKAKLRLDTAEFMRKGGTNGTTIVPGKSAESLLIHAVKGTNDATLMPYKRPALTAGQIRILAAWIDQGAKAPADEVADDGTGRSHWAFKTPVRPALPQVKDKKWVRNPIDYFILERLEKETISPSPLADKTTLIRRLYLDLLGLPPSLKDVQDFVKDERPDAYERLVDHLLASPHYGERWGRHWLDLARYADTSGFTIDAPREIWKYRDWVIEALNKDMPFDQFVIEQMAGDMLPNATLEQKIATGFHRNTLINQEGGIDVEQFRVEAVADRVATTGTVFLGLTMGCARCHDHKFDPVSQREFFQIFYFLNNQSEPTLNLATPDISAKREVIKKKYMEMEEKVNEQVREYVAKLSAEEKSGIKGFQAITTILNLGPDQRTEKQRTTFANFFKTRDSNFKKAFDEIAVLRKQEPKFPTTMVLQEMPKPRETFIHIGGDFTRKGPKVGAGVPSVLHALSLKDAKPQTAANRLDLARWLVDKKNPLIGRVTMNRLWMHYFGKGIVETENDFGLQGTLPSHPELLDWLATKFMDNWSLKAMHRLIVTSATYRQASRVRPELAEIDPDNKYIARQTRLRLDAEIVRDNALAVSGLLSREMGGPSVYPPQPENIYQFTQVGRAWRTSTGAERYRRGIYTFFQRSLPYPALTVFDAPDGISTCTRRIRSNTPLQALTLLNDQAFMELALGLAERVLKEIPNNDKDRLRLAFRLSLAREPSMMELRRLEQYFDQQLGSYRVALGDAKALVGKRGGTDDMPQRAAWTAVARVLMNLDEFITRE